MSQIPLVDLVAAHAEVADEVDLRLRAVFETAGFVGGPVVAEFEAAYARFVGVEHCIGVANGTDALELVLRGMGVGRGDDVVLPAHTFVATAEAVERAGARVVLCDVDEASMLVDPSAMSAAVTPTTRVLVPVHLYGQAAPVERVTEVAARHGLAVLEDAAQSQGADRHGRRTGSLGEAAATSFYPGKNLGAAGDAGAVTTSDSALARRVRRIAAHGSEKKYEHVEIGMNSRLDAVQAAVLSAKLARLDEWNSRRRQLAERYDDLLGSLDGVRTPVVSEGNTHVWHLYVVRVDDRDRVLAQLNAAGIGAGIHYPRPVHLHEAFAHLGHGRGDFPVSERIADEILSLPIHPHLDERHQDRVVEVLGESLG